MSIAISNDIDSDSYKEAMFKRFTGYSPNQLQKAAIRIMKPRKNHIVVAPTGSGKTFAGAYGALQNAGFDSRKMRMIYFVSTRAAAYEMYKKFKEIGNRHGLDVSIINKDFPGTINMIRNSQITVITYLKFQQYTSEKIMKDIVSDPNTTFILDEVHEVASTPEMEFVVAYLKSNNANLIGLSATINDSDIEKMALWLDAIPIRHAADRPVPLRHHIIPVSVEVNSDDSSIAFKMNDKTYFSREYAIADYVIELSKSGPVMVWAPTRAMVEDLAMLIATECANRKIFGGMNLDKILVEGGESDKTLKMVVNTSKGYVAFHHGGISSNNRNIIQDQFTVGKVKILVVAYTLSQSVNTSAKHVVIPTLYGHDGELIGATFFHQLAGRAGRPGYSDEGLVHIFVDNDAERSYVVNYLLQVKADPLTSSLYEPEFLKRSILRLAASGYRSPQDLSKLVKNTFWTALYGDKGAEVVANKIAGIIEELVGEKYIEIRDGRIWFTSRDNFFAASAGLLLSEKTLADNAANMDFDVLIDKIADRSIEILSGGVESIAEKYKNVEEIAISLGLSSNIVGGSDGRYAQELADKMHELAGAMALYRCRSYGYKDQVCMVLRKAADTIVIGNNKMLANLRNEGVPQAVLKRIARNFAAMLGEDNCIDGDMIEKIYEYATAGYKTVRPWFFKLRGILESKKC
jgi:replicative superfamily II helicase